MSDQYREVRLQKLANWKERQVAYPGRFAKTHSCVEAKALADETKGLACSGRLMSMRVMGKLAF
ncbi:MAG: hypothetical protein H6625_06165, partial [Bdellovibrionaceae bacterium]|nr:hypothetical protein [Pseudobdellovibrionaceae bacterium]